MRLFLAAALALAACGAGTPTPSAEPIGATTTPPDGATGCPATMHRCPCRTGGYCLGMGQMCRNPSADCPAP